LSETPMLRLCVMNSVHTGRPKPGAGAGTCSTSKCVEREDVVTVTVIILTMIYIIITDVQIIVITHPIIITQMIAFVVQWR
jgi:hypothetical protein